MREYLKGARLDEVIVDTLSEKIVGKDHKGYFITLGKIILFVSLLLFCGVFFMLLPIWLLW